MGLRVYTVHLPPSSVDDGMPVLVKEGFSWPALVLGILWTLWHRLWIESAALLALFLALGIILDYADPGEPIESVIMLAVAVLIGAAAADWRRQSLQRRGYREGGVVSGPDMESALRRFLDLRAIESQTARTIASAGTTPVVPPLSPSPGSAGAGSIAGWYASAFQPAMIGERGMADDPAVDHRSTDNRPPDSRTHG